LDGEVQKAKIIYHPPRVPDTPDSRMSSAGIHRESLIDLHQPSKCNYHIN